jgi:hypothetical protein
MLQEEREKVVVVERIEPLEPTGLVARTLHMTGVYRPALGCPHGVRTVAEIGLSGAWRPVSGPDCPTVSRGAVRRSSGTRALFAPHHAAPLSRRARLRPGYQTPNFGSTMLCSVACKPSRPTGGGECEAAAG